MATLTDFKKSQDATGDNLKTLTDGAGNIAVAGCTLIEVGGVFVPVDASNPLPVTGPLTDAELRASAIPVSLASVPSHEVTNAGTFPVQLDGDALTALQLLETIVSGSGVNVSQLNGVTVPLISTTGGGGQQGWSVKVGGGQGLLPEEGVAMDPGGGYVYAATLPMMTPDGGTNRYFVKGDATDGMLVNLGSNNDVDVTSIAAGANLIGDVSLQPRTTGGLTMHKTTSATSTNATSVKASPGQIYSIQCFNVNAEVRYLKIYNKASAPTVGTDTPVKTLAIPGNTAGAGFVISWPQGLALGTGIAFALTTEATDAGTTGVALNEITVNIDYK